MRRFDFQQAVEAQAKEEALAQQRAAAAKEQQQRLEQLLESQNKIARAQAAIPGTLPSGAVPQAPRDFSQSITGILAPAQAARETLGGIEKQIDAIAVGMQAAKLRSEDYDKILRDLGATFGALQRQANLVESFRQQEQATERLLAELTKEQNTLEAMNVLYERTKVYDEAQVRNILDQTNKVKGLTAAFNAQNETFSQSRRRRRPQGSTSTISPRRKTRITEAALRGSEVLKDGERCDRQG
jgi:vacuolar-type H+-ATPase subunit I/STV1